MIMTMLHSDVIVINRTEENDEKNYSKESMQCKNWNSLLGRSDGNHKHCK